MSESAWKKARTHPPYELLYWPSIPGRGEFVRLAFEAAGVSYKDVSNDPKEGLESILPLIAPDSTGTDGNPPIFAPPALRVPGEGLSDSTLLLYQTPSILTYLGPKLNLAGSSEAEAAWILSHTLTALDLNNEIHDTHHPVSTGAYYEDQKDEALRKSEDVRKNRIPKFLGFFERVLKANEAGKGKYLVGNKLSFADTTLWHILTGLEFAFPKEMKATKEKYPGLYGSFYDSVQDQTGLKEYLASDRRKPFSNGVFRHYLELDRQ